MNSFSLTLSADQLLVLDRALQQLPYGQVAPLINEISRQLQAQHDAAKQDAPAGS
jgi:hypothetical protein